MKLPEEILDDIHNEAYIEACEICSPNSLEFPLLLEKIEAKLLDELYAKLVK